MNRNTNTHSVLELLGNAKFQVVSALAESKWDSAMWKTYCDVSEPNPSRSFDQFIKSISAIPMAAMLDPQSNKPLMPKAGFKTYGGDIPYMGIADRIDEQDIAAKTRMLAAGSPITEKMARELTLTTMEDMYDAMNNRLKFMTLSALSTGVINIDASNQVNGVSVFVDLNIPTANKVNVNTVWSDPSADPVKELLDKQRYAKRTLKLKLSEMHWEMSQELYDVFIMHPNVIKATTGRMNILNADNYPVTDGEKLAVLSTLGIKPIVVVDEEVSMEVDGVLTPLTPFDIDNIVLVPNSKPFKLENSPTHQSTLNTTTAARSTVGFITAISMWEDRQGINTIDMEAWALPVFKDARNILIVDTASA